MGSSKLRERGEGRPGKEGVAPPEKQKGVGVGGGGEKDGPVIMGGGGGREKDRTVMMGGDPADQQSNTHLAC